MRVRGGLALLLLGYLISLTLCAEARPPDPTWIAEIYEDDDHVVCLLTSGSGAIETGAFAKAGPLLPVAGRVSALESDWPLILPGFSSFPRPTGLLARPSQRGLTRTMWGVVSPSEAHAYLCGDPRRISASRRNDSDH